MIPRNEMKGTRKNAMKVFVSKLRDRVPTISQFSDRKQETILPILTPTTDFSAYTTIKDTENLLPIPDFITSFREISSDSLRNAYVAKRPLQKSVTSGNITTGLCEDVFFLVDLELEALYDYLKQSGLLTTEAGDTILVDCLLFVYRCIWYSQRLYRKDFLIDLEASCAAANDFFRMMERTESVIERLKQQYPHLVWDETNDEKNPRTGAIVHNLLELVALFSRDAVYSAENTQLFVFRTINHSSISTDLFSRLWEETLTHNQVAFSFVETIEDYLFDIDDFLCNDFLLNKAVHALIRAGICFYVRCLVQKADTVRHKRRRDGPHNAKLPFQNPSQAADRISYDIEIMESYFKSLVDGIPALSRSVENDFAILITIHECLGMAVGNADLESLERFIMVLHKKTGGNLAVTKCLLLDVWYLFAPSNQKRVISDIIGMMQAELQMISKSMKEAELKIKPENRDKLKGLTLDEMLGDLYEEQQVQICAPFLKVKHNLFHKENLESEYSYEAKREKIRLRGDSLALANVGRVVKEKVAAALKSHNLC